MKNVIKNLLSVTVALGLVVIITTACTKGSSSVKQNHSTQYKEKSYSVNANKVNQISLSYRDRNVELVRSTDNAVHITYFQNDKESYEINVSDENKLKMKAITNKRLKDYIGLDADKAHRYVKIAVPSGITSGIDIKTSNGDIDLSEVNISGAVDATTSNGKIKVSNVAVDKNLKMESKNDDIILSSVGIKGTFDATTSNGNIEVTKVAVKDTLKLSTTNGDITGIIKGAYDAFSISSHTSKGKNNLPENKINGDKTLDVSTNNGDINLEFVN
ncbi:DUF4097 domain-containing protein [Peribacillus simplex]|uniref:DUF4097 domain-containing protein n=1 Tax=Peribacillus simplex TaxID=1478 RepID=A0A8B5XTB4_9BACI|nr:DUF4097 family beta strand repeat-containing protein [Peribacillus simplex]MED3912786.1 DUF4097 family beta strand repeat-containing protein [Peribacillus simplex]TVX77604.1 DUF4097 domain-containing protein [Peribacillus simplex]